jgi:hypothetical protein
MRFYEAVAVILVGAIALLFVIRRTRESSMPRNGAHRLDIWATNASPLLVAAVVVTGLLVLGAENLLGSVQVPQLLGEHSLAVQNLFFRH